MKKYIIGVSAFIALLFVIALAIGQSDDSSEFTETPDGLFVEGDVSLDESTDKTFEPENIVSTNTSLSSDPMAFEIPLAIKTIPEQILVRENYTTSYNKDTKCPNWVAWHLEKEKTDGPYSRRGVPYYDEYGNVYGVGLITTATARGSYMTDMDAESPRQEITDWDDKLPNNSHGHICPAADNRWSKTAMNQSFLLTNMCPQDEDLNAGDWAGLEVRCRGWAKKYGIIFIAAGPIFYNGVTKTMGKNKVGVPDAFFKVILRLDKKPSALGFIFPNNGLHHKLEDYLLSVDEVERITGFDFFCNLQDDIEFEVEKESILSEW